MKAPPSPFEIFGILRCHPLVPRETPVPVGTASALRTRAAARGRSTQITNKQASQGATWWLAIAPSSKEDT